MQFYVILCDTVAYCQELQNFSLNQGCLAISELLCVFQGELADNEGNGDKEEVSTEQTPGPIPDVGEESELQSQLSESGSIQDTDLSSNPRGVGIFLLGSGVLSNPS